jgi:hypothetical protein
MPGFMRTSQPLTEDAVRSELAGMAIAPIDIAQLIENARKNPI